MYKNRNYTKFNFLIPAVMDPTHRWNLYRKALRMDIPEENMHDFDEEKYYSQAEHRINTSILLSKLEIFEDILLHYLKNDEINEENQKFIEIKNIFSEVKDDAYTHLTYSSEYSVLILFSIVEMLQDKKAELIEKAKEGEAGYIIKEISLRLNAINVILNDEKNDVNYYENCYITTRKFLASTHAKFFDKKFDQDKSILEEIKSKRGTIYFLLTIFVGENFNNYLKKWKILDNECM
ncbi:unnamed protein product [Meloidogyne enterolobii]|uniref:Uncharacterized protein n=1 Tax=Meloidogyne enterolobii TaxID=390850 RepID=A0ACB1AFZ7_MELEN